MKNNEEDTNNRKDEEDEMLLNPEHQEAHPIVWISLSLFVALQPFRF